MKYYITYSVNGYVTLEVNAKNQAEAEEIAESKFSETDFGELEEIDGLQVMTEEEQEG